MSARRRETERDRLIVDCVRECLGLDPLYGSEGNNTMREYDCNGLRFKAPNDDAARATLARMRDHMNRCSHCGQTGVRTYQQINLGTELVCASCYRELEGESVSRWSGVANGAYKGLKPADYPDDALRAVSEP